MASWLFGATAPLTVSGFEPQRPKGSAVAKTINPTPKPAPNIMENHEKLENSGASSVRPILRLPVFGRMATTARKKANIPTMMI